MYTPPPSTSYGYAPSPPGGFGAGYPPPLPRPPAGSAPPPRFVATSFAYNGRVAAALLPCLAVLAGHGGAHVAAVLLVGPSTSAQAAAGARESAACPRRLLASLRSH